MDNTIQIGYRSLVGTEQTDATEPEQAGWFFLQVNSRPADPKR